MIAPGADTMWLAIGAALLVAVAAYAQHRIPRHTAGLTKIWLARGVLALVGTAFGYMVSRGHADTGRILAFLCGFGAVHVPAAIILFVKGRRGSGRS